MFRPRSIILLLALLTLAVYLPVARHGFILYDDGDYITKNPVVQNGLTLAGVEWAFTTFHSANWHPLTWLSHMADCQWFGLNAAGPHCVNVLIHAANTVLVFLLWLQLCRHAAKEESASSDKNPALWPATFIAVLFAVHPLHVESVAWLAERKDVLSAFFGLLALIFYARYVPGPAWNPDRRSNWPSYGFALFFFTCGIMSKPMLVTWPFLMLLLDYWPLQRYGGAEAGRRGASRSTGIRLFVEKIPFFALTVGSCIVTYLAQSRGAVKSLSAVPLAYRLENAPVAISMYLLKMIWPAKLAVIYPMPHAIPPAAYTGCTLLLMLITAAVWLARRESPFLPVGWFWFLGTLVPVIGLVKVGDAAMADRYTYIPSIGIFMAVAFGAQRLSNHLSLPRNLLPALALIVAAALMVMTERQLRFWRSDAVLFGHAVRVTANNVDAMLNYGVALENEGKPVDAMAQYRRAEQLAPSSWLARVDLADLLYFTGQTNAALEQYQQAVNLQPDSATLHERLGGVLADLDELSAATNQFLRAINLAPSDSAAYSHLAMALARQNDWAGATNQFAEAVRLAPGDPSPLVDWAKALLLDGRDAQALNKLREALLVDPEDFQTLTFTARVLAADENATIRNGPEALALAQKAAALTRGGQPLVEDVLAMALAENGEFDAAQTAATAAIQLARADGMKHGIVAAMQERLELYEKHEPWREKPHD